MAYRDLHDELRTRIEEVERELARARAERQRLPTLERELRDLRASLEGRHPRRWWAARIAAGAGVVLFAAGGLLGYRRGVAPREPIAPGHVVPVAQEVLSQEHEGCVKRLARAPEFHAVTDFAHITGDLRLTWTLTSSPGRPRTSGRGPFLNPDVTVRLGLAAGAVSHGELLGAHAGAPYPLDLTFCRDVPRGGPCGSAEPSPPPRGVIAELSIMDCLAYSCSGGLGWMVVRTPSSALVLRGEVRSRPHQDRQICDPKAWEVMLEIQLGPGARVIEEVQFGDPPKPFDCEAWGDGRCTG